MSLIQKVFEKFRAENDMDKQPNAQTIYFKDGKMYKVYPTDKESWYNARYLVSDGKTYDLDIKDIRKIPIPKFDIYDDKMTGYGITGSLDYVIRMKAGNARKNGLTEESNELYKKSIVLMKHSGIAYNISNCLYLAKDLLREGKFKESEKEEIRVCQYVLGKRKKTNYITQNEREYYRIKYMLPDIAPKSLSAYTRMKNINSEKFIKITEAAKKIGIKIK